MDYTTKIAMLMSEREELLTKNRRLEDRLAVTELRESALIDGLRVLLARRDKSKGIGAALVDRPGSVQVIRCDAEMCESNQDRICVAETISLENFDLVVGPDIDQTDGQVCQNFKWRSL